MTKQLLKIYGERNTGTNYLSQLIELNLQVEQIPGVVPQWLLNAQKNLPAKEFIRDLYFNMTFHRNLGWKHSLVKPAEDLRRYAICAGNISFVTVSKNPYSWLLSLYRRPYHQYFSENPDFETFLATPWKSVGRDNAPGEISSPVELWNIKNASYIQLATKLATAAIKFEDLLDDPERVLRLISESFSYEWKVGQFRNYDQSTKESSKDSNYYKEYYLNEKWKEEFSPEAIATINERLDREVMSHFGYQEWVSA